MWNERRVMGGRRAAIQFIACVRVGAFAHWGLDIGIWDVFFHLLENGSSNCAEAFRNALTRLQVTERKVEFRFSCFSFHLLALDQD